MSIDVESPASGTLLKIVVSEGEAAAISEIIGYIGIPGEDLPESKPSIVQQVQERETYTNKPSMNSKQTQSHSLAMISPIAKRLAKENGIDYKILKGTGPGGRIVEADIKKSTG